LSLLSFHFGVCFRILSPAVHSSLLAYWMLAFWMPTTRHGWILHGTSMQEMSSDFALVFVDNVVFWTSPKQDHHPSFCHSFLCPHGVHSSTMSINYLHGVCSSLTSVHWRRPPVIHTMSVCLRRLFVYDVHQLFAWCLFISDICSSVTSISYSCCVCLSSTSVRLQQGCSR
jgi:hypothetical protein